MSIIKPEQSNLVFKRNPSPDRIRAAFYSIFEGFPVWELGRDDAFGDDDVVSRTPGMCTGKARVLEISPSKDFLAELQKERGRRRPILQCVALFPKPRKDSKYARMILPRAHSGRDAIIRS